MSPLLRRFLTRPAEHLESEFFSLDASEASLYAKAAALRSDYWSNLDPVRQAAWLLLYGRAQDMDLASIDLVVHLREWYLALESPQANETTLKRLWKEAGELKRHRAFLTTLFYPLRLLAALPSDHRVQDLDVLGRSVRLTVLSILATIVGEVGVVGESTKGDGQRGN